MKNLLKFGFLAMVITLSASACGSGKSSDSASDTTSTDGSTASDTAVVLDNDSIAGSTGVVDSLKH